MIAIPKLLKNLLNNILSFLHIKHVLVGKITQ
jgi:hypothetical protein